MIKPIVLSRTVLDSQTLFSSCKTALGYIPNRAIDAKSISKEPLRVIAALNEFMDSEYTYSSDLEGLVLDYYHYMIGVIVESYVYMDLLHYRMLNILSAETVKPHYNFLILGGSLRQFRDAIIDGSTKASTTEIRELMNSLHTLFVSEGLNGLWSKYTKSTYNDSMILIEKK